MKAESSAKSATKSKIESKKGKDKSSKKSRDKVQSTKTSQNKPSQTKPSIEEVCDFLCAYSSALLKSGAYTSRIIKCTERIAQSFGYDAHLSVFLKYITINITDKQNYNNRRTQAIKNTYIAMNLALISNLSALSWQIYDDRLSLEEARAHYQYICAQRALPLLLGAFLIALGNATFCKLFDGDFGALLCIFMGSFVGFWVRQAFVRIRLDNRAQLLFTAFIVSFVAYIGVWLGLSRTPDVAIGGSILYLIPGALIINAFVDIIHENTLMGISRMINMMVLMICLAAGVYLTLAITKMSILNG
ncbi:MULTISPECIES: threonine/serine ThrE exporter family protein [unclassified Helicobacter]|uniref:threonine/serine ThrE exporter family protein n=1 Tax=unclassified Helicobacter TaxID=2593540 RepID=UPI0009EDFEA4|nr:MULTISPECIES: threonine/serine exporter family protein [unclassified Helicobacter]